jgi:shikimate kinase
MTGPHLVLVGMMGAGKTTVGRLVAARTGRAFLDSDALVEARTGRTVAQIFADDGEAAFRAVEHEVLADMLDGDEPVVVAAAGGAVLDPANRARLSGAGTVVWLRAEPAALATRVRPGDHRPLLAQDPAGTLARLAGEREALYREVADVVVDVGGLTPDQVADRALEAWACAA